MANPVCFHIDHKRKNLNIGKKKHISLNSWDSIDLKKHFYWRKRVDVWVQRQLRITKITQYLYLLLRLKIKQIPGLLCLLNPMSWSNVSFFKSFVYIYLLIYIYLITINISQRPWDNNFDSFLNLLIPLRAFFQAY